MGRRTESGLAGRIVRVALVIGVVTVMAAAVVAVVSIARLSSRHIENRDIIVVQLIQDRIESRLRLSSLTLDQIAERLAAHEEGEPIEDVLGPALGPSSPLFRRVLVADGLGLTLFSSEETSPSAAVSLTTFQEAVRGRTGFGTDVDAGGEWTMWGSRRITNEQGRPLYLLAELDTGFLRSAIAEAASESASRRVVIVEEGTVLVHDGDEAGPRLASARWEAESATSGRVTMPDGNGNLMSGLYAELRGQEQLPWRLVVLEPVDLNFRETMRAVAPPVLVLLVGGAIGLVAAWSVSARLVRPLRELERAARTAAAGSFVQPIEVVRDDEIGRVAEAFNQVALRLNALHDLSQLLASASRLDQVLEEILSAVGHLVGPGAGVIYLLDAGGDMLVPAKVRTGDDRHPQPVPADGDAWLAKALLSAGPLSMSPDPEQFERELPGLAGDYGQVLAAPLVAGKEPLGVVVALRASGSPLTEAEREMVRTFSAQAAVAVQTSRLFEQENQLRRVAETLRSVAEQLVRPEGLDAALRHIERVVLEFFEAQAVSIIVVDSESLALPGVLSAEEQRALATSKRILADADGSGPALALRGDGDDVDALLGRWESEALLVVPVALDTDHGAVMLVAGGTELIDTERWRVAESVADELALAFDNAYFYERALTRAANLETIFRISQAVGSSLQINVVLNRVLDVVQKILSADAVALLDYQPRTKLLSTAMARGDVPPGIVHLELSPGVDIPGRVFSTGQPITVRALHAEMEGLAGQAAENGLKAMLAVPLMARGRPIGVLIVFSKDPRAFTEEDTSVLQTFAIQASLAIDTARLYSREHEVASVLQKSILPEELPDFPEVETGSIYAPAGNESEIGGDYYDLFRSPTGDIWFAIADVCGKGVVAATKTSMIKYALRALVAAGLSPSRVLEEVNRMVAEAGQPSDIVTVWVGRLEGLKGDNQMLTWANGGHPPGLLQRSDGELVSLSVTGPLLGAIKDVSYEELSIPVSHGDRVLLYTDGVTEARHGNVFFGEQRVRDAFSVAGTAEHAARHLLDSVRRFVRAELRDDVAVLVVSLTTREAETDS